MSQPMKVVPSTGNACYQGLETVVPRVGNERFQYVETSVSSDGNWCFLVR